VTLWFPFLRDARYQPLHFTFALPFLDRVSRWRWTTGQGCPGHPQARCLRHTGTRLYLCFTVPLLLFDFSAVNGGFWREHASGARIRRPGIGPAVHRTRQQRNSGACAPIQTRPVRYTGHARSIYPNSKL